MASASFPSRFVRSNAEARPRVDRLKRGSRHFVVTPWLTARVTADISAGARGSADQWLDERVCQERFLLLPY
jgi:hypothetical protein